ncbi:MAG TPA: hypothetical protein VF763_06305 [Candidatus Limnocylindrales bacterium]
MRSSEAARAAPIHEPRRVHLRGPLDLPASLERFRRWGDDLLERWDGEILVATAPTPDGPLAFAARPVGSVEEPAADVLVDPSVGSDAAARSHIPGLLAAHLRAMFVGRPEAVVGLADLASRDPVVAALAGRYRGLHPVLQRDPLTALVRSISAQQVNLRWAATTRHRLAEAYGREHAVAGRTVRSLDAATLAAASVDALRALQFTRAKAVAIVAVARAVADGGYGLTALEALPDEAVIARLIALPGVGPWTAEWFLARTLGRPRVVAGDLGVRKAVGAAYLGRPAARRAPLPSETEVRAATAHWGAAAGIVQQLLLQWLGDGAPPLAPPSVAPRTGDDLRPGGDGA